jgi:hypothetical protein
MKEMLRMFCAVLLMALCMGWQTGPVPAGETNVVQRLTHIRDTFNKIQYDHTFTYDQKGRVLTHLGEYRNGGQLKSSDKMVYAYDANGKLLSKIGKISKYLCFYDQKGTLARITQEVIYKGQWVLCEETLLTETENPGGKGKQVHFLLNKSTPLPTGKMSALEKYSEIHYILDKSNNINKATILASNYKVLEEPIVYEYYHDNKPNPIQNMFVERWYQFDLENGGLTNMTRKRYRGRIMEDRVYEYNELGYPTKYVSNGFRTKTFTYTPVEVPAQEEPEQAMAKVAADSLAKTPAQDVRQSSRQLEPDSKPFVLLYPNPASVNFTVRANNLGKGEAVLRVFDYFSMRVLTQVPYQVDGQLEALITTNGMPAGLYIVELTSPNGKLKQRLLVQ